MNRYQRCGFFVVLLSLSAVLAVACQRLDPGLTGGRRLTSSQVDTGGSPGTEEPGMGGAPGTGGEPGGMASDCPTLRMQAHDILETNCAICHQAPGTPALYLGSFSFILDLGLLTSSTSPQSSTTLTLKYVAKGNPGSSYIYQRITNGSMPPVTRTQRPTPADMQVLNQWITGCIDDPTSPEGWSGTGSRPDAGADAGPMLDNCGRANVCPNGGCCVSGLCRPNGTTCGAVPNPIPGQADLQGLAGVCTSGSCKNAAGNSCGKVGEPCCEFQSCTASQSSCLVTDMTMCSACGGAGQPCCKPTNCLEGHACVGGGVGRVGICQLCGGLDQVCCGSGGAALQTCGAALFCVTDSTYGTRCTDNPDGGARADAG